MPNPLGTTRSDSAERYEAALEEAIQERNRNAEALAAARQLVLRHEMRDAELVRLAQTLAQSLPVEKRAHYLQRCEWLPHASHLVRKDTVSSNVISLFASDPRTHWTAPEVQSALNERGFKVEARQINNALDYLARRGRLVRLSHGRYFNLDLNAEVITSDEIKPDDYGRPTLDGAY